MLSFAGAQGRGGKTANNAGENGGRRGGTTRTAGDRGGGGCGGRDTQGTSDQGQAFNGTDGVIFPESRPPTRAYRCHQPGHRHTECIATITLQHSPALTEPQHSGAGGQGNAVMATPPHPPPCSAGPSAPTASTITPTYASSPYGGHQHPQQLMGLVPSGQSGFAGHTCFSKTIDGREIGPAIAVAKWI